MSERDEALGILRKHRMQHLDMASACDAQDAFLDGDYHRNAANNIASVIAALTATPQPAQAEMIDCGVWDAAHIGSDWAVVASMPGRGSYRVFALPVDSEEGA